jgi:predicted DsbA family dithiol-disulfide isomerase
MEQVMNVYGVKGQVAWVYRHFPLYKADANGHVLHPNAGVQAEALECAASLGGNSAFWSYEKAWYNAFPQDGASRSATADLKQLKEVAKTVGLDEAAFSQCLSSGQFKDAIDKAYMASLNDGANATPYTVIITPSGSEIARTGAQSYTVLKSIIDTLLSGDQSAK